MTTFDTGRKAELAAAEFLQHKGCKIVAQNWRTRRCEIDVIAEREGVIYFCEVKYRSSAGQGSGLEYITPKKLAQMKFACECWVAQNNWQGEYRLCAIEVSGKDFSVTGAITDLL